LHHESLGLDHSSRIFRRLLPSACDDTGRMELRYP
jgi:hypothetical protein